MGKKLGAGQKLRAAVGVLFFLMMFAYAWANVYRMVAAARADDGWMARGVDGRVRVLEVDASGPAAGAVRVGDELVALEGQREFSGGRINGIIRSIPPGGGYRMTVVRDGREQELDLKTRAVPAGEVFARMLTKLVVPASFLLTALAVFLLKPFDKEALLLALMLGMFVSLGSILFAGHEWYNPWLVAGTMPARVVAYGFFGMVFLHFFLVFPESKGFVSPLLRRFPRLETWLYLLAPVLVASRLLVELPRGWVGPLVGGSYQALRVWFSLAGAALTIGCVALGLVSLVLNYRRAGEMSRRKLRVVLLASVAGFVPLLLLASMELFGLQQTLGALFELIDWGIIFVLPLVPLSFAYAIVRHKVIPVSLIIRRGVRYLFVARGSVALEVLVVGLVMFFLMDTIFTRTTASGRTVGIISGVVAILVWVAARAAHMRLVAPIIDRRFFRRSYNAQQILSDLGQALRTLPGVSETCALVATRVQEALQTENVTVFLREEATGDYACECSSRFLEAERQTIIGRQDLRLPRESFVVARLAESVQPLEVDFGDPDSWARSLLAEDNAGSEARRREGEVLREARAALLLPVATKEQLVGVVSLGPRLGDLPFSGEDRQMLSAVAVQVAFALENAKLFERRAEEERLRRELEMATEVQSRIFPERAPDTEALELAGSCAPARGVGGDYYDFLLLEGGRVGVAVADVAGKGMSAALLMSIVQASLRSQAESAGGALCELVASMNRLLHRSSGTSSYATFFYAQFDQATRRLSYVNAGHNPPMLVRGAGENGSRVELLKTGGPVIGLFEHFTFDQETVETRSGDLLVAFTDGVTEALNPEGEEFGESRLLELVTAHAHLSAAEVHDRVVENVRAFCRDAPQHDDLTLVVAKVK